MGSAWYLAVAEFLSPLVIFAIAFAIAVCILIALVVFLMVRIARNVRATRLTHSTGVVNPAPMLFLCEYNDHG
jgi:hypothetical protein